MSVVVSQHDDRQTSQQHKDPVCDARVTCRVAQRRGARTHVRLERAAQLPLVAVVGGFALLDAPSYHHRILAIHPIHCRTESHAKAGQCLAALVSEPVRPSGKALGW